MAHDAPVLPWAVAAPPPPVSTADAGEEGEHDEHLRVEDVAPVGLDSVGLSEGSRIEVKWNVSTEGGDLSPLWWRCRVVRPEQAVEDAPDAVVYNLDYEKLDGHDPESRKVCFTGSHDLLDVEEGGLMAWRREGDLWDNEEGEGEVFSAQEILAQLGGADAAAEAAGTSHAQMVSKALDGLPMDIQLQVAERVRNFTDGIVQTLKRKLGDGSDDEKAQVTITMADVEEMVSELKRSKH